jgi:hypothetical protein
MTTNFTPKIFAKFMQTVFQFDLDELKGMAENEFIVKSIPTLYGEDEDVSLMQEYLGNILLNSKNVYNYVKHQHILKKLLLFAALYLKKHKECVGKFVMAHTLTLVITLTKKNKATSQEQADQNELNYRRCILIQKLFEYVVELSKKIVDDGDNIDMLKDVVIYYEKDELNPGKYDISKLFEPLEPAKLERSSAKMYTRVSTYKAYLVKDEDKIKDYIYPIYDENDEIKEYMIPVI